MDLSIKPISAEIMRERGAQAFDEGLREGDHGLLDREQIKNWQYGWHTRRVERKAMDRKLTSRQLEGVCPP